MRETAYVKDIRAAGDRALRVPSGRALYRRRNDKVSLGTPERPSVALLRHVLNPAVIVVTLLGCLVAYGQPIQPHYLALAGLAFLIAAQLVSDPVLDISQRKGLAMVLHHRIFTEWLLVSAVLLLLAFAFKVTELFSRRVILTWFALTPFAVVAAQASFRRYAAFSALRGKILQSHVIIGANEAGWRLARRLQANPHLGAFRGFFDDRQSGRLPELPEEQLLGSMAEIADYVRLNGVSNIYICLPIRPDERVMRLIEELKDTTASVYFVPDIFVFDLMQAHVCSIDGIPLLAVCESPFSGMNGVLKRASDILFGAGILTFIWPVLLAIAIGVRYSSPGPILFRQRRYGLYGESIHVYKFRTMTVCEDSGAIQQAQRNDPRVTRFGGFLRRTSLDELPQLFNVLHGEMSLVGPRPPLPDEVKKYEWIFRKRLSVKPGITCVWQISGRSNTTFERWMQMDNEYIDNWSIWLDLKILVKTVPAVLLGRGAS